MQAFRATVREASRRTPAGLRFARGYSSGKTYEHLLVSSPKPGVGLSMYLFYH
jgi:enoyl-CoA hydratase